MIIVVTTKITCKKITPIFLNSKFKQLKQGIHKMNNDQIESTDDVIVILGEGGVTCLG